MASIVRLCNGLLKITKQTSRLYRREVALGNGLPAPVEDVDVFGQSARSDPARDLFTRPATLLATINDNVVSGDDFLSRLAEEDVPVFGGIVGNEDGSFDGTHVITRTLTGIDPDHLRGFFFDPFLADVFKADLARLEDARLANDLLIYPSRKVIEPSRSERSEEQNGDGLANELEHRVTGL